MRNGCRGGPICRFRHHRCAVSSRRMSDRRHSTGTKRSKRVGGSEDILRELVELFRVECPKQMAEIREQKAAGDLPGLARAAHTLKGSVGIFAAQAALRCGASHRDRWAATAMPREFDDAWADLQREIDRLSSAFEREFTGSAHA